jgi:hypothetical protein
MTALNKRKALYEILVECGYSDWIVVEPGKLNPESIETKCVLFNYKQGRKAEAEIPHEWFEDPRRYHTIGELITLAIDNAPCAGPRSAARRFFIFAGESAGGNRPQRR